jgi:arsenite methyltransferase
MNSGTEVKEPVGNWYGGVASGSTGCCSPSAASKDAAIGKGYSAAELASLLEGADLGLGCGNPQALAAMRPGEVLSISAAAPGSIAFWRLSKSGRPAG